MLLSAFELFVKPFLRGMSLSKNVLDCVGDNWPDGLAFVCIYDLSLSVHVAFEVGHSGLEGIGQQVRRMRWIDSTPQILPLFRVHFERQPSPQKKNSHRATTTRFTVTGGVNASKPGYRFCQRPESNNNTVPLQGRIVVHPVPPYALCWASGHIVAAGCDFSVQFYDQTGRSARQFDYYSPAGGAGCPDQKEFTVACSSPSGQAVVVGSFNRFVACPA